MKSEIEKLLVYVFFFIIEDHETRLSQLEEEQSKDRECGELIEMNAELVDKALNILRNAIANQIDWKDIEDIVEEAGDNGDPVLSRIRKLKLDINHFTMLLANPYEQYDSDRYVFFYVWVKHSGPEKLKKSRQKKKRKKTREIK